MIPGVSAVNAADTRVPLSRSLIRYLTNGNAQSGSGIRLCSFSFRIHNNLFCVGRRHLCL